MSMNTVSADQHHMACWPWISIRPNSKSNRCLLTKSRKRMNTWQAAKLAVGGSAIDYLLGLTYVVVGALLGAPAGAEFVVAHALAQEVSSDHMLNSDQMGVMFWEARSFLLHDSTLKSQSSVVIGSPWDPERLVHETLGILYPTLHIQGCCMVGALGFPF